MEDIRILLVDDEEALRPLLARSLRRLGFAVDECANAREAWARFAVIPCPYKLAVVDLTLPDIPGEELVRQMLAAEPGLRVIVISGFPFDIHNLGQAAAANQVQFLQKPFLPKALLHAVNLAR